MKLSKLPSSFSILLTLPLIGLSSAQAGGSSAQTTRCKSLDDQYAVTIFSPASFELIWKHHRSLKVYQRTGNFLMPWKKISDLEWWPATCEPQFRDHGDAHDCDATESRDVKVFEFFTTQGGAKDKSPILLFSDTNEQVELTCTND